MLPEVNLSQPLPHHSTSTSGVFVREVPQARHEPVRRRCQQGDLGGTAIGVADENLVVAPSSPLLLLVLSIEEIAGIVLAPIRRCAVGVALLHRTPLEQADARHEQLVHVLNVQKVVDYCKAILSERARNERAGGSGIPPILAMLLPLLGASHCLRRSNNANGDAGGPRLPQRPEGRHEAPLEGLRGVGRRRPDALAVTELVQQDPLMPLTSTDVDTLGQEHG
mmetsp:Transcript_100866/g.323746  ORF Transcript_100866/g.323746 Transcript_100866/m.323746 type:complete len:223 (+) Transcript_100866:723-1391(+)